MSLDGFLGDISDDEVRHRKSSSNRGPPGRRKPEKVVVESILGFVCFFGGSGGLEYFLKIHYGLFIQNICT